MVLSLYFLWLVTGMLCHIKSIFYVYRAPPFGPLTQGRATKMFESFIRNFIFDGSQILFSNPLIIRI